MTHAHHPSEATTALEVTLRNCHGGTDLQDVETFLHQLPGVLQTHLDRTRSVAHVQIDPAIIDARSLRDQMDTAGYTCTCHPGSH